MDFKETSTQFWILDKRSWPAREFVRVFADLCTASWSPFLSTKIQSENALWYSHKKVKNFREVVALMRQ